MAISKKRRKILAKCNNRCAYCGDPLTDSSMHKDHVIPKGNFENWVLLKKNIPDWLSHLNAHDVNHIDNLMPSCFWCNCLKANQSLEQFRTMLSGIHENLMKNLLYKVGVKFKLIFVKKRKILFYYETIDKRKKEA